MMCKAVVIVGNCVNTKQRELFESRPTNISYLDFGLKPAVFSCFTNAIAPLPVALES